jgi:hypothetical protein
MNPLPAPNVQALSPKTGGSQSPESEHPRAREHNHGRAQAGAARRGDAARDARGRSEAGRVVDRASGVTPGRRTRRDAWTQTVARWLGWRHYHSTNPLRASRDGRLAHRGNDRGSDVGRHERSRRCDSRGDEHRGWRWGRPSPDRVRREPSETELVRRSQRVTSVEPPSSENLARTFGEWKVWFEWGSVRFDDPGGKGVPPAWFVRQGSSPSEAIPAIDLKEAEFRWRLGGSWMRRRLKLCAKTSNLASPPHPSARCSHHGREGRNDRNGPSHSDTDMRTV